MSLTALKAAATAFYPLDGTTSADEPSLVSGAGGAIQGGAPGSRWERNGRARVFVSASSKYLVINDAVANSLNDAVGCTIAFQVKMDTVNALQFLVAKGGATHGEYFIGYDNTPHRFIYYLWGSANYGGQTLLTESTFGAASAGQDLFVVAVLDAVAQKMRISINGGALSANEAAHTTGIYDSTTNLYLGRSTDGYYVDGSIRNVFLAKGYVATDADVTAWYNGGNVLRYSELDAGAALATCTFSPTEAGATVVVPSEPTMVIPRPTVPAWASYVPTGTKYYVDPAGDNSAAGAVGTPFRTIARGLAAAANPGDAVYVNAGSYIENLSPSNSGAVGNPIILSCAPGALGQVRVTHSTEAYAANSNVQVIAVSANYVWLNGLNVEGYRGRAGAPAGGFPNISSGIYFDGAGTGCVVSNCAIHHHVHCGIKYAGHGGEDHVSCLGNLIFDIGSQHTDHGIYCGDDDWNIIGNVIWNTYGWGIHLYATPARPTVRSNVTFSNGLSGPAVDGGGILMGGSAGTFEYNTCYEAASINSKGMTYYRVGCTSNITRYNLFVAPTGYPMAVDPTGGYPSGNVDAYNDYSPSGVDAGLDLPATHYKVVDPLFVNPTNGDLRLAGTSTVPGWGAYPARGSNLVDGGLVQ